MCPTREYAKESLHSRYFDPTITDSKWPRLLARGSHLPNKRLQGSKAHSMADSRPEKQRSSGLYRATQLDIPSGRPAHQLVGEAQLLLGLRRSELREVESTSNGAHKPCPRSLPPLAYSLFATSRNYRPTRPAVVKATSLIKSRHARFRAAARGRMVVQAYLAHHPSRAHPTLLPAARLRLPRVMDSAYHDQIPILCQCTPTYYAKWSLECRNREFSSYQRNSCVPVKNCDLPGTKTLDFYTECGLT
ncbi:hypothetical protein PIIN_10443 [Serendipita indica DSM 11827]|uniref:Uncharacterized protein n=1 Tax=Serendipita indica (strain DSM 11827) TaxID=1109443 RepID=G4TYQ7_SERID|nr:hypothetical protein PIIN_10443 [Serendipita indica DSM 11827]